MASVNQNNKKLSKPLLSTTGTRSRLSFSGSPRLIPSMTHRKPAKPVKIYKGLYGYNGVMSK